MDHQSSQSELQRAVDLSFLPARINRKRCLQLLALTVLLSGSSQNLTFAQIESKGYLDSISKSGLTRWNKIPVKVYIESSSDVPGFKPEFALIIKQAFEAWQTSCKDKLTFEFLQKADDAQIVCKWTNDKKVLMNPNEGGNTQVVPSADGIFTAQMLLLTTPPPGKSEIESHYLTRVALHEIGHAIGITGHSPNKTDIMFSIVYPDDKNVSLSQNDIATINSLYSMSAQELAAKPILQPNSKLMDIDAKNASPQVRALQLNNEAAKALQEKNAELAKTKLEEAHVLDPNNQLVNSNLGSIYGNYGAIYAMAFKFPESMDYFKKSIDLLEKSNNKPVLTQVLTNYVRILQMANQPEEVKKAQAKLAKLTGAK